MHERESKKEGECTREEEEGVLEFWEISDPRHYSGNATLDSYAIVRIVNGKCKNSLNK